MHKIYLWIFLVDKVRFNITFQLYTKYIRSMFSIHYVNFIYKSLIIAALLFDFH